VTAASSLTTEYPFTLPKGYVDAHGTVHREGTMRLATAMDELAPMRDPRVKEHESYSTVIVLARVVAKLGSITVTTKVIEDLFVSDFTYLQDFYRVINFGDTAILDELEPGVPFPSAGEG
jgi:hypothetical protein